MSFKRLVLVCALPSFLAGCSEFYGSQPPAPVYGGEQPTIHSGSGSQKRAKPYGTSPKQIVETQPLKGFSEVKPEPMPLPAPVPLESAPLAPTPLEIPEPSLPSPPTSILEPKEATPPPPVELTPFEPIEATVPLSPAVGALVSVAKQSSKSGDLESAAASMERAIRIEPRNATLFYKLALLRLEQSKPRLAEDLAKKIRVIGIYR